jgi:hypothetical protein
MNEPNGGPELRLPADFDELWEVEAKGWFSAELVYLGRTYAVNFYDPVRLAQTIEGDLETSGFFFEENLVVVRIVNRQQIEDAVRKLFETGQIHRLIPSQK